jgi:hypothetical protein
VRAEPSTANEPVLANCLKKAPSQLRSRCASSAQQARNVASHHCKQPNNKDFQDCIIKKANGYIEDALKDADTRAKKAHKKRPDQGDFTAALKDILQKAGGDPSVPAADPQNTALCKDGKCSDEALNVTSCKNQDCDFVGKYVNPAINLLSLSFGVIAAISIIAGGIQYSVSAGDPQKVSNAKKRILNTIVAIVAYMFLYSFLQFLVPGGLFN